MTDAEWAACRDGSVIYLATARTITLRLGRLVACACCRFYCWELLPGRLKKAVEVSERFADGESREDELQEAWEAAIADDPHGRLVGLTFVRWPARYADPDRQKDYEDAREHAYLTANHASRVIAHLVPARKGDDASRASQASIYRDAFPLRLARLDPAWLSWNGGTVQHLAQAAYAERHLPSGELDAARLAVLADALEEAGCADADILSHLRGPGPHVRGCWAVDLLLDKS
jgi:hypothetical protein